MAEQPHQFANREDPIPILSFSSEGHDDEVTTNAEDPRTTTPFGKAGKLEVPKRNFVSSLGEKLRNGEKDEVKDGHSKGWTSWGGARLQDQLYKLLLENVIPTEDVSSNERSSRFNQTGKGAERPAFSIPTMSVNFRRFNARIGIAFVFQARLIRLFTWRYPTQTLSFLAVYSFVCLEANLLPVLPILLCLFYIMIPAYLARHRPIPYQQKARKGNNYGNSSNLSTLTPYEINSSDYKYGDSGSSTYGDSMNSQSSSNGGTSYYSADMNDFSQDPDLYITSSPPLNPPPTIQPVPDLSRDFFRNMRDLQNSMEDFSRLHDALAAAITPLTNFSDESRSSALFIGLVLVTVVVLITGNWVPWRGVALVGGWTVTVMQYPGLKGWNRANASAGAAVAERVDKTNRVNGSPASSMSRLSATPTSASSTPKPKATSSTPTLPNLLTRLKSNVQNLAKEIVENDIILPTATPESQQVEIFEFQRRKNTSTNKNNQTSNNNNANESSSVKAKPTLSIYESSIYTSSPSSDSTTPHHTFSPHTLPNTSVFEDVLPPQGGWRWAEKKWRCDFRASNWVAERALSGVVADVDVDERGFICNGDEANGKENSSTIGKNLNLDGWVYDIRQSEDGGDGNSEGGHGVEMDTCDGGSGEEGNEGRDNIARKRRKVGEWRRRRWIRMVERGVE